MHLAFGGINLTFKSGALIPVLLMLPNVVWMLLPKTDASEQDSTPLMLTIVENIGRAAVMIFAVFLLSGPEQETFDTGDGRNRVSADNLLCILDKVFHEGAD